MPVKRKKTMHAKSKQTPYMNSSCQHHKLDKLNYGGKGITLPLAILSWGLIWFAQELGYLASYINATPVFLIVIGLGWLLNNWGNKKQECC